MPPVLKVGFCRHMHGLRMQVLGADGATIQMLVGCADVNMTKHYLRAQEQKKMRN